MSSVEMLKRLAIRVAGLSPIDRSWLYIRLSPDERRSLEALVSQVKDLGLHHDPDLLRNLTEVVDQEENDSREPEFPELPSFWRELLKRLSGGAVDDYDESKTGGAPALRNCLIEWAKGKRALGSVQGEGA